MAAPEPKPDPSLPSPPPAIDVSTRRQIRGSSLLLFGRLFSLSINFAAQVLVVRALSKSDYGAFAYALSMVALAQHVSLLGLSKAVARFVPLFQERSDYGAMFGTMVTAFTTVVTIGLALILTVLGLRGFLGDAVISDPLAVALLMSLIALAPLQSLDDLFQNLLSVLARPRAIFLRRYVLKPLLKLGAILFVMAVHGDVRLLAVCYVVAGTVGVALYAILVWQVLRQERLLDKLDPRRLRYPLRRIFRFSVPLLSSNLVLALNTAMSVFLLGRFHGSAEVAGFRGVVPVANLTLIVFQSFKFLYVPMATRMLARRQPSTIHDLFWQSAVWTAVLTFPIFAACTYLAEPVTVLFFGSRYVESSTVLALLAAAGYLNAVFGLNADTLEVYARVRVITGIAVLTAVVALGLGLLMIPHFGAMGAALATLGAVVTRNVANHVALTVYTDVRPFDATYWRVYASIVFLAGGLLLVQAAPLPLAADIVVVAATSVAIVRMNRRALRIVQTFPALGNVWFLRPVVGARQRSSHQDP